MTTTEVPSHRRPLIAREYVDEHRRRRYVDAVAELLHEFARPDLTVTNIVRLAHTSRGSFYDLFSNTDDCIAYCVGVADAEIFAALETRDGEREWLAEVHEAIVGFYSAVADQPLVAELFLIHAAESLRDDGQAAALTGAERFVPILGRGRAEAEALGRPSLPAATEEYFSHAIVALAASRIRTPDVEALPEKARAMTALVGAFYLGPRAADRILAGLAPEPIPS